MDCLDCHNRPAHTLASTPAQVVDRAIVAGEVSTKVPFVRSEMVDALSAEYPDGADASAGHRRAPPKGLRCPVSPRRGRRSQVAERLYRENVFPAMKITWGTYTNNSSTWTTRAASGATTTAHGQRRPREEGAAGLRAVSQGRVGSATRRRVSLSTGPMSKERPDVVASNTYGNRNSGGTKGQSAGGGS